MQSHGLLSRWIRSWARLAPVVLAMGTAAFASPPGPTTRNVPSSYATIQAAINAANPGDIVDVAAGVYHEQLSINKALTVTGPDGASGPGGSGRAVLDGSTLSPGITWTTGVKIRSGNVTLNNLDITNFTQDGITAYDNINMPNLHITNCKISNIQPGYWGFGIYVGYESEGFDYSPPDLTTHLDFTGLLIEGNEITNVASSALVVQSITGTPGTLIVRDNWIHDNPDNDGIWIETARNVTFEDNILERNLWGIEVTSISEPWYELDGALSPKDIVLRRNVIKQSTDSGLTFYNAWPATFTIERNQFSGNLPYGVRNRISALAGSPVVAAPCNWWGHVSGPSGPGFTGTGELLTTNVSVDSWLSSPDLTVPDAPIIGVATGSDNAVSVTFTPACNDGGSVVLSYTATCGSESVTGASSPLVVEGLPFSPDVTCTVVATNAIGPSLPSSASNSVTPQNPASISVSDVSIAEGDTGEKLLMFTITRTGLPGAVTFDYATSNGTATAASDYIATSGSGQIEAGGSGITTIAVPIVGDLVAESNETFNFTLSNLVGGGLLDGAAVGTITNDDIVTLSVANVTLPLEGHSGTQVMTFTVTRQGFTTSAVTFDWTTVNGTASAADSDYVANSGTGVSIPAGGASASTTVTVTVNGDTKSETNETFSVVLSNPSSPATLNGGTATGTIMNDDEVPSISIDSVTVAETESTQNMTFTVSLSAASGSVVSFEYATQNQTAASGSDYTSTSGTLSFAAGDTTPKTITVPILGDAVGETTETFRVLLSSISGVSANASFANGGAGIGTINDNDALTTLSVAAASAGESAGTMSFTISLNAATNVPVSFTATTSPGTALQLADYTHKQQVFTIPASSTTATFTVTVKPDLLDEADETFNVTLSNVTPGIAIGTGTAAGTITDDDATPTVSVTGVTLSGATNRNFSFAVSLSAVSGREVTVLASTADGTATAPSDYTTQTDFLVRIPAGTPSVNFRVPVKQNTAGEGSETFTVVLTSPTNATIGTSPATGTINP